MFKSRLFSIFFVIIFIVYWFVLFPLFLVFIKPVIIENGTLDWMNIAPFWTSTVFCVSALIIFIVLLLILWCVMCYRQKKHVQIQIANATNSNLNSLTIHSEANKNIKDRVQLKEISIEPCESDADGYRDIFTRRNNLVPKYHTAIQTSDTSILSSPTDNVFNGLMTSSCRLNSCDRCSKLITDEEMVNIFVNKSDENDTNDNNGTNVKFEVVGKSVPQAKRFEIVESITQNDDEFESTNMTPQQVKSKTASISIPVKQHSTLKSEVFFIVNDDYTIRNVDGNEDVFK